jgi:pyridoxal phosphate enzyme (YggS family)
MPITDIVESMRAKIKNARNDSALAGKDVTLLGASKGQPVAIIQGAIDAGVTDFGENRVQEAEAKWPALRRQCPEVRLHLIGPLQTNKVRQAVELFDVIQTVDRAKLAEALAKAMREGDKRIPCFIQINTGKELQKGGIKPEEADAFIDYCKTHLSLPITGLMCIPPVDQQPSPHFALIRSIAMRHGLDELSMGMSNDFEIAVRMGSTCVRLGRVLFGKMMELPFC